jgi:hypothetical protein
MLSPPRAQENYIFLQEGDAALFLPRAGRGGEGLRR